MIDIANKTGCMLDAFLLQKIASKYTKKDIELIVTDNTEIQAINKTYRNIDKPTDVLSFPFTGKKNRLLGTIIISCDYVKRVSLQLGHTPKEELTLLFIHGLLHLLGFDHEVDDGEMRKEEEKLILAFDLPKSLIVRSEDVC